jgi:hypothetical protein
MLQLLNQYGWYLLIFGMMFLMHRRGIGGCCGGHHNDHQNRQDHHDQHGTKKTIPFESKK